MWLNSRITARDIKESKKKEFKHFGLCRWNGLISISLFWLAIFDNAFSIAKIIFMLQECKNTKNVDFFIKVSAFFSKINSSWCICFALNPRFTERHFGSPYTNSHESNLRLQYKLLSILPIWRKLCFYTWLEVFIYLTIKQWLLAFWILIKFRDWMIGQTLAVMLIFQPFIKDYSLITRPRDQAVNEGM